jgi:hypothetical protein
MHIGEQIATGETLDNEFKEFCLKKNVCDYYDFAELDNVIQTGVLPEDFNKVVDDALKEYFTHYVPKYASAFSNCKIQKGYLCIGVNDYGEVTGIPYVGQLDSKVLKQYFKDALHMLRGFNESPVVKTEYVKQMKLEIIQLDTHESEMRLYDVSKEIIESMNKQKQQYDKEYKAYLKYRDNWLANLLPYTVNINQILQDKRTEVIKYVLDSAPSASDAIIKALLNPQLVITSDDIQIFKEDIHHHIYWIFKFKDDMVDRYLSKKPRPPIVPKICNSPFTLMTQLSDMRAKFIRNNQNLKYYMIRIHFPGNIQKPKFLEYYHPMKETWMSKTRVVHPLYGPCCL